MTFANLCEPAVDAYAESGGRAWELLMKAPRKPTMIAPRSHRATTRSTAGPGYDFEDLVAAWLMVQMLAGTPIPIIGVQGRRIRWQSGKPVDDLEISGWDDADAPWTLSLSCKSNIQVSRRGLPTEFLIAAWQQSRGQKNKPRERMALVTRDNLPAFNAAWADIKAWCAEDPETALDRIHASEKHSRILEGIVTTGQQLDQHISLPDAVAFVQTVGVLPLYFQLAYERSTDEVIGQCRRLLGDGKLATARKLWKRLIGIAKDKRGPGGSLELSELIALLRSEFLLLDHPDFSATWRELRAISKERMESVETSLPSGHVVQRLQERGQFVEGIAQAKMIFVHGESGIGKSALVRTAVQTDCPTANALWLRPSDLERFASEPARLKAGIAHPLIDVLRSSPHAANILVVDSAETMSPEGTKRVGKLIADLREHGTTSRTWSVIVVAQTASLERLRPLQHPNPSVNLLIDIGGLPATQVRSALRSIPSLAWLALDGNAVSALANLKTLAWVMQAPDQFGAEGTSAAISQTMIADRLWQHWTSGRLLIQQILERMAQRDAEFQPNISISDLQSIELKEIQDRPDSCPIVVSQQKRLEFKHDLAADWSRYQNLKEVSDEPAAWAARAHNPRWHAALRLLGQQLLRQHHEQRSSWDTAFEELETTPAFRSGADLLLDALYLDPLAKRWLAQRTELLFANDGKRLDRMLERFHHVATIPAAWTLTTDPKLRFFVETSYRSPIPGRWEAVARFLHNNRARVARLGSKRVARVCETWLKRTPVHLASGRPMFIRMELAEVAVAAARELQLELITNKLGFDSGAKEVYAAAFAAAPDLPNEVTAWALEMARRRPLRNDLAEQRVHYLREREREEQERLHTDVAYREWAEEANAASALDFLAPKKLPPWPMGPAGRVDQEFRHSCCHDCGLDGLMRLRPNDAAEILLAVMVDDCPVEEFSPSALGDCDFGLAFDDGPTPPIYWTSPFYKFLHINPDVALQALIALLNFCTERWLDERKRDVDDPHPGVDLAVTNETPKRFIGNERLYGLAYDSNMRTELSIGALGALERWLWDLCESGSDVSPYITRLLSECNSLAVLGVLVSAGKARPALFDGPLRPLLLAIELYLWDQKQIHFLGARFDAFRWLRAGENVFEQAKSWTLAPFRNVRLATIGLERQRADKALAAQVREAVQRFKATYSDAAGEMATFLASLDPENYRLGENGQERFVPPPELSSDALLPEANETEFLRGLPSLVSHLLQQRGTLADDDARHFASLLDEIDELDALEATEKPLARIAIVALLIVKADVWLASEIEVDRQCITILDDVLAIADREPPSERQEWYWTINPIGFASLPIATRWLREPGDDAWDRRIVSMLTSGIPGSISTVLAVVHPHKNALGKRWRRLLEIAVYCAALHALRPRHGGEVDWSIWTRWRNRFQRLRLNSTSDGKHAFDLVELARRVERLHHCRFRRHNLGHSQRIEEAADRQLSWGLDSTILRQVFGWALPKFGQTLPPTDLDGREGVKAIWEHEAWRLYTKARREDRRLGELGYDALAALARITLEVAPSQAGEYWRPVLELGPNAHAAGGSFINHVFLHVTETTDAEQFSAVWRQMADYALQADWPTRGRGGYHGGKMLRGVLGFNSEPLIAKLPSAVSIIEGMKDIYAAWAQQFLARDEENIAAYASFLIRPSAVRLRLTGLVQIAEAVAARGECGLSRHERTGDYLVELLDCILSGTESDALANVRAALMSIADALVLNQTQAALGLQDRIRNLQ